jgi:hypothetical protein
MQYKRQPRCEDLPVPVYTGKEHEDEAVVREFDSAFDNVAVALGKLYLVDTEGGQGIEGAPISMSRYVDVCRQHTIVVNRRAWHPDIITILHKELERLSAGWTLAIDATEFPPGKAHIVVEADGTVHGWSDFSARSTLTDFGFEQPKFLTLVRLYLVELFDSFRKKCRRKKPSVMPTRLEDQYDYIQKNAKGEGGDIGHP